MATSQPLPVTLPARPSRVNARTLWAVLFLIALGWALRESGVFDGEVVNTAGWTIAARFFRGLLAPELSPEFLGLTLNATLITLGYAVLGTFLSVLLGFFAGLLASETWWEAVTPRGLSPAVARAARFPWVLIRASLAALRAIHELIWGLIFVNIFGLDPLTAILAIAIPFGAVVGKVFSEILDEAPRAPFDALRNSGVPPLQAFAYTLLPQALPDLIAYSFYRFECAIRAAAVLGIIGAGGLGFEIFLSLQTLKYNEIWTLLLALFALNALADFWSGALRRRIGKGITCSTGECAEFDVQESLQAVPESRRDPVVRGSLIGGAILVPLSFWFVKANFGLLFAPRTFKNLADFWGAFIRPTFSAIPLGEWVNLSLETLAMSLLAVAAAGLLGLALAFPAANNFLVPGGLFVKSEASRWRKLWGWGVLLTSRFFLLVARSIPPPIWALLFLFMLFPGILPGAAALGLYTLGVLGRLMAEVIENLDPRPLQALQSGGASPGQVFSYGALPMTTPRYLGYLLYRWEENIRATVVVGLVGAGGLGILLREQLSSFDFGGVALTLAAFILLTFAVDMVSARVRRAFR